MAVLSWLCWCRKHLADRPARDAPKPADFFGARDTLLFAQLQHRLQRDLDERRELLGLQDLERFGDNLHGGLPSGSDSGSGMTVTVS
jgi:hypothetical protein